MESTDVLAPPAARGGGSPWLVTDIGGTNARFGWTAGPDAGVFNVRTVPVQTFNGPAEATREYLRWLSDEAGIDLAPQAMAMAVATAVAGDRVALTNSHWDFSCRELQAALGLQRLRVLNDFEALALSLPHLGAAQLQAIGPLAQPLAEAGALAVVGPGTGLGVAGLLRAGGRWHALPGEGGHATLAAADEFEAEVLAHARRQWPHVSAERLLSGIGLPLLHEVVAQVRGRRIAAATAPEIVDAVTTGADPDADAAATMACFAALLGGFCGNVALTLGARGGVFIGGGILPRLGERFDAGVFRQRFEGKGRFAAYLKQVPTLLIVDTLAALSGAAASLHD